MNKRYFNMLPDAVRTSGDNLNLNLRFKFHRNRTNRGRDMEIAIFTMVDVRRLE